ncbi:hypothetical protein ENUP19_0122G0035 [Entamoeba nuttalli]|uniref:Protein kinase domain containing protein n=1 Tax=Entamoeba nuttalli TaxID=412467 RepID=A0ABQ0DJH1_9EUKA
MLIYYIILLIICINAKAYNCNFKQEVTFNAGFNNKTDTLCESTYNEYSYYFTSNFTYSLKEAMECNSTDFNGNFIMTSLREYWNAKTFTIQKNSQITLDEVFSFQRLITFETTPSLNQPQLVIWYSIRIHLYRPTTTSTGQFEIQNPRDNKTMF